VLTISPSFQSFPYLHCTGEERKEREEVRSGESSIGALCKGDKGLKATVALNQPSFVKFFAERVESNGMLLHTSVYFANSLYLPLPLVHML